MPQGLRRLVSQAFLTQREVLAQKGIPAWFWQEVLALVFLRTETVRRVGEQGEARLWVASGQFLLARVGLLKALF